MKYNILIILSLLFFIEVEAQNYDTNRQDSNYKITLSIPSQKDKLIYLGQYWKGTSYAIDSVQLSNKGEGSFRINKQLDAGQYFFYAKPSFQVDLLIGDNQTKDIHVFIDENNPDKNKITGSRDSELLWAYLIDYDKIRAERYRLEEMLSDSLQSSTNRDRLQMQLNELVNKEEALTNRYVNEYEKEWFGIFLKGSNAISLPFPQPESVEEYLQNKNYGRVHFFDNIALTDPRIWRTNYIHSFIDSYMKQWIDPVPDSLANAAKRLVEKSKANDFTFKEMLSYLTNTSLKSNIMGEENIWAGLFETYILDKNIPWIDSIQYAELRSMYEYLKNNRIGMTAHNLQMETADGRTIQTNDIEAEFLLLYFYDPNCTHCQTEVPKLHNDLYARYKDKGLKVVAVNIALNENNKSEWEAFIQEKGISDWINCADSDYKSKYWMYFDTSGVPSAYILDKYKQIIARKINEENIETVIKYYSENGIN